MKNILNVNFEELLNLYDDEITREFELNGKEFSLKITEIEFHLEFVFSVDGEIEYEDEFKIESNWFEYTNQCSENTEGHANIQSLIKLKDEKIFNEIIAEIDQIIINEINAL